MNTLWSYFWPAFAAGLVIGGIAGSVAFRRRKRAIALGAGVLAALAAALLWHGPLGAADRLTARVERNAGEALAYYEMTAVTARLHRAPLTRQLALAGPADDFQRSELVRLLSDIPGVGRATWNPADRGIPLIVEGMASAVAGFLMGLVLAYLVELRRRYNLQWKW